VRHVFNDRVSRSLLQSVRQQQTTSRHFVDSFREKNCLAPLSAPTPLSTLPSHPAAIVISSSSNSSNADNDGDESDAEVTNEVGDPIDSVEYN
jgi:hypothetical protein